MTKNVILAVALILAAVPALPAGEPDATTLRARAALALAFAAPKPAGYAEAYTRAVQTGRPLVVFVGQPVRELPGCVCVGAGSFPGAAKEAVVIGLPAGGGLRRLDLPGRPSPEAVRAVLASRPAPGVGVLPAGQ